MAKGLDLSGNELLLEVNSDGTIQKNEETTKYMHFRKVTEHMTRDVCMMYGSLMEAMVIQLGEATCVLSMNPEKLSIKSPKTFQSFPMLNMPILYFSLYIIQKIKRKLQPWCAKIPC